MSDWITCIEAAYDLSGDDEVWLGRLAACGGGVFRRGSLPLAFRFRCTPSSFRIQSAATRGPSQLVGWARRLVETASAEAVDRIYRRGEPVNCLSQQVFPDLPQQREVLRAATGGLVRDVIGLTAHAGTGEGVSIGIALPMVSPPRPQERRRWPMVASHLGAALRLRQALSVGQAERLQEAVLSPGGEMLDACDEAALPDARQSLRDAVRRIDRSRTREGRRDADAALDAWTAMVEGRWSLVDRFDADGRRFVVALRNDAVHADPRGLNAREQQVAGWIGLGRSIKEIGYTMGLSGTAVVQAAAGAQRKLGMETRAELAAFFSPSGPRACLAELALAGEHLLVGSWPMADPARLQGLSPAEQAVAALLLAGSTQADMARHRGVSERTVANQVQGLYRKLGVHSRVALAAVLQMRAG